MALLAAEGKIDRHTVCCPHPEARESCTIVVYGWRGRAFASCPGCKAMFEGLITGWANHALGPKEVVTILRSSGYTRVDAARFLLELVAKTLGVRLGFARG